VEFSKGGLDIVGGIEFGISLRFVGSCAGEGDGDGDGSVRSGSGVRALSRFDARGCRFVYDPSFFDYGDLEGLVGLCCMLVRANWLQSAPDGWHFEKCQERQEDVEYVQALGLFDDGGERWWDTDVGFERQLFEVQPSVFFFFFAIRLGGEGSVSLQEFHGEDMLDI
jgi:hypothetical protein